MLQPPLCILFKYNSDFDFNNLERKYYSRA
jgi:hypothetical protein